MKWSRIGLLVLTVSLLFAITNYHNVQASSDYQIVKTKYYTSSTPFHAKNPKQNTYLWNAKHTKP